MADVLFENVILVDYDGVCAFWEHSFAMWMMHDNGYGKPKSGYYSLADKYSMDAAKVDFLAKMFNESAALSRLPPMRDAMKYIEILHRDHGYVFHCISAIPPTESSYVARWENIHRLFGQTAFERLVLCGSSENKDALLERYAGSGCYWIEDVMENAKYGLKHGLQPILMHQHYNTEDAHPDIPRVVCWKEIYHIITGS